MEMGNNQSLRVQMKKFLLYPLKIWILFREIMPNTLLLMGLIKRPEFQVFSFSKILYRKNAKTNTVQTALEMVLKCFQLELFTDTIY